MKSCGNKVRRTICDEDGAGERKEESGFEE
jgi:hypothetical protein